MTTPYDPAPEVVGVCDKILCDYCGPYRDPNPEQSRSQFVRDLSARLHLTGLAFVWKILDPLGTSRKFYVLQSDKVIPKPPSEKWPLGCYVYHYFDAEVEIDGKFIDRYQLRDGKVYHQGTCLNPLVPT